jgi:hypothetical protein
VNLGTLVQRMYVDQSYLALFVGLGQQGVHRRISRCRLIRCSLFLCLIYQLLRQSQR